MLKEQNVGLKLPRPIDIHSVYAMLLKPYRQNDELLQDVCKLSSLILKQFPKRLNYEVKDAK